MQNLTQYNLNIKSSNHRIMNVVINPIELWWFKRKIKDQRRDYKLKVNKYGGWKKSIRKKTKVGKKKWFWIWTTNPIINT